MIIKKVIIENFLCYYSRNEFSFSQGTNIIIGHNGSGKTKFLEALDWFFKTNERNSINGNSLLSEKARKRATSLPNGSINVSVTVEFETITKGISLVHTFTKSLVFQVDASGKCTTTGEIKFIASSETPRGERMPLSGSAATKQLDILFPVANRKFCLFKGEAELNVLKEEEAFKQLINLYASSKQYEPYEKETTFFLKEIEERISKETKQKDKNFKEYEQLEVKLKSIGNRIKQLQSASQAYYDEESKIMIKKLELEKFVKNSERFNALLIKKEQLKSQREQILHQRQINYLQYLFDKQWILKGFTPIQNSYLLKIKALDRESRKQQSLFDQEIGQKKGAKKALLELINGATPLRINIPSQSIMQEMLDEEICKFCNREALKGSEEYNFIQNRLTSALEELNTSSDIDEKLYVHNIVSELDSYSNLVESQRSKTQDIEQDIHDIHASNAKCQQDSLQIDFDLKNIEDDINSILAEAGVADTRLSAIYKEFKEYEAALTRHRIDEKKRVEELEALEEEYKRLETEKNKKDLTADKNQLIPTRDVLRLLNKIVSDTKNRVYVEFIDTLQKRANHYFYKMNEGFFTGSIAITRKVNGVTSIQLIQNGQVFVSPNSSLETTMNLAVLFAINELTRQESGISYPLIFDAPTSTFDDKKRIHFYNTLSECAEQVILLTKDFISPENSSVLIDEFNDIECSTGYMIQLNEGFSPDDLATVSTNIVNL